MTTKQLQAIAREHGSPVVVIDHGSIRKNDAESQRHLPKVQAYYAVRANAEPAIVRSLYQAGASFDVASLPEFMRVYSENIGADSDASATGFNGFAPAKVVQVNE